jgi:hypothetical protein
MNKETAFKERLMLTEVTKLINLRETLYKSICKLKYRARKLEE